MKISKAQQIALERLSDGAKIMTMKGFNYRAFWLHRGMSHDGNWLHLNTFFAIREKGLLEIVDEDWKGATYTISELGKEVLSGQN